MKEIIVYTDGSCFPNPGYGAWAAIITNVDPPQYYQGTQTQATNNQMELAGILHVLSLLPTNDPHKVTLYSDSQYVVKSINYWMDKWERHQWRRKEKGSGYVPIKNAELFQKLAQYRKCHKIVAVWIRGHNGDYWNNECDLIANGLVRDYYHERKAQ